jgi:hypothetical protein
MTNRIRHIRVTNGLLSPTQAEMRISVVPEFHTPTTEVRGRLMGPRCPYASTIEVAYPLRAPPGDRRIVETPEIVLRVIIPEPSFWDTDSPFLYEGPVELWQDGQCCDQRTVCHGLRSGRLGKRGLLVNDRPLLLQGQFLQANSSTARSEDEARRLHEAGFNLLVTSIQDTTLDLWQLADRFGLFIMGRLKDYDETTPQRVSNLLGHVSCLGWLIETDRPPPQDWIPPGCLLGWSGDFVSPGTSLEGIGFLYGTLELARFGKPLLVRGKINSASDGSVPILGCVL